MPKDFSESKKTEKLKNKLINLYKEENKKRIKKALKLAEELNYGHYRKNNDPAIMHPLMVALKTAEIGLGPSSVCAALLHNILDIKSHDNENNLKANQIKKLFGKDVFNIINGLTKLKVNLPKNDNYTEIEAAQKYLIASIDDLRIIIIKIADKLHNLHTIEGLDKEKRKIHLKRLEKLYLPLTYYLGLKNQYTELSDLLLLKTDPKQYNEIKKFIKDKLQIQKHDVSQIKKELKTICNLSKLPTKVQGRLKSISAVHKKLKKYQNEGRGPSMRFIKDVLAFRIITKTKKQCYKIADTIQKFYDTVENTYEDYITNPKKNGYQSIHITLEHPKYGLFELQIRTEEMHEYCEYGPAAHFAYKSAARRQANPTDEYKWIKEVNLSDQQFGDDKPIKVDIFKNQIFVFTPDMEVIQLPKNATPLDLAYKLHTELGNQCIGATVNKRMVKLYHKLKTGDIVKIKTDKNKKNANKIWLKYVVTSKAKKKIKQSLKRQRHGI